MEVFVKLELRNAVRLFVIAMTFIAGCAHQPASPRTAAGPGRATAPAESEITGNQLLVAVADSPGTSQAQVYALERTPEGWQRRIGPVPAMTGRNGFAPPGEKREGDGRAPSGLFPLESAFGYAASINTKMPYHQATENDLWVDDVNSPDYNTWVKRGESKATSFEEMKRQDHLYRYGIVTGYNRNPVIAGSGSAIFVHVWQEEGFATSGCVAMPEKELAEILKWLDPAKRPMILMGNRSELAALLID
jgi:L,D-peptidoglycan transpeptidase YkuD (ErfK/YbiS/YcfS/YnhG family)